MRLRTLPWVGYAAALAASGLMTAVIGFVLTFVGITNLSMLYLIVVLATAITFGRGPAIVASVAAFLMMNWFFTQPVHTLTIADPAEWLALLLFLLVAAIAGQLAASQRQRKDEAEQHEREAVVLYDVVRLMSGRDFHSALRAVAERLHDELELAAVAIKLIDSAGDSTQASFGEDDALRLAGIRTGAAMQVLGRGPAPTGQQRGGPGRWIRVVPPYVRREVAKASANRLRMVPVMSHGRRVGELLLVRHSDVPRFTAADDRLLSAVATQLGVAVERVWLQREATEAEILRRTGELKTALLNAVSHDLRTPLASIIASAGSLRQHDVQWTEAERQELAEAIEEEALRLNQIVGNLLDLSRIEGETLKPEKGWYDLGALVDDVLGRLRPVTAKHHISVDIPDDLPPVLLDYVEIDQVLSNLIENATKYAAEGTEIRVSAHRADGELQVEVSDRGPGVPPAAMPHLFEPFYRLADKVTGPKGTGLGLAVAKGLVEAHGGRIWAENRRGGGARFVFTLPLHESEALSSRSEAP
ncbi:MAG: DUF4118 domain-containing protein [Chloroflexi bacterium]|nr:DUF4118 domain-containing protein [Chloroflexota bacterium]